MKSQLLKEGEDPTSIMNAKNNNALQSSVDNTQRENLIRDATNPMNLK